MRNLSLSRGRNRLTLVIPDQTPLRAAAKAVRGFSYEGRHDDLAVFSFPAAPDVVALLITTFAPDLAPDSRAEIERLHLQSVQLEAAVAAKEFDGSLGFPAALKTRPMAHQIAAMNFGMARIAASAKGEAVLHEQGTGKTLTAIGIANGLFLQGAIRWVLVVAPNSLRGTWGGCEGQILEHTNRALVTPEILIPAGTRGERVQEADDFLATWHPRAKARGPEDHLVWVVMNYDSFALQPRRDAHHKNLVEHWARLNRRPGLIICDESTMVKNPRAARTRVLTELTAGFRYTLVMTGTPVTASPLDVYAQFEVLEQGCLGFHSYLAFDREYAMRQRRRLHGGGHFEEVVGFQNLDDLERRVAKVSHRARAKDCLDLPEVVIKRIPVTLTPTQARTIDSLKEEFMAELGAETVDGRNILTRLLRMAQTVGGYVGVLDEDGNPAETPRAFNPNPKLDAWTEYLDLLLEDPTQKAVVFSRFVPEIEAMTEVARERGWKPVPFYGSVKPEAREEGLARFRKDPGTRLFIAQYQTGSKGLTLVEAATVIFYSLTFSLEDMLQARKRVHRIGQTKTVTEVYLLGQIDGRRGMRQTIDHLMLRALQEKQRFADLITGDHRALLEAL